jgi:hypothetical protein
MRTRIIAYILEGFNLILHSQEGRREALESLVSLMYDDLRMLARRHLRCQGGMITLHTSGLVHEAYLKLAHQRGDLVQAELILREAIAMHRPLLPGQIHRFAECLQELGEVLVKQNKVGPAEAYLKEALGIFEESKGSDSIWARETRDLLAELSP